MAKSAGPAANCNTRKGPLTGQVVHKAFRRSGLRAKRPTVRGNPSGGWHMNVRDSTQESHPHREVLRGRALALPGHPPRWTLDGSGGLGSDQPLNILCRWAGRLPRAWGYPEEKLNSS